MEDRTEYVTDALEMIGTGYAEQPAAIIDQPRNIKALNDAGLYEYKAWGWVKLSAKFIAHLRHLKGAKLAIWQCIALSIDETGTCKMTLKDIGALTDYSHTEVIESIKELEAAGYLTVNKDGKTNIYQPVFVARGENKPQETLVKKLDSTPVYQYESSSSLENSISSIKRVKRVKADLLDMLLENEAIAQPIRNACLEFETALLGSTVSAWPWDSNSKWQKFAKWVAAQEPSQFFKYAEWRKKDGKYQAMSNNKIRQDPQMFIDTGWPTFLAHVSMYRSNEPEEFGL
jgi:hypothetical protein